MSEKIMPKLRQEEGKPILSAPAKTVLFLCVLLTGLSAAPVLSFYLGGGGDLQFHLCRIEAIRQALLEGQFPVRISGYWCDGYGYASSLLYGELFLYFPAALRIIGFSPQDAYKLYLLAVNLLTCLSAYYCLYKIFGERLSALMGTAVYMLTPHRLSTLHLRAAVGEYTAMAFLPFLVYGLYLIYTQETGGDGKNRAGTGGARKKACGWLWLALGFSGLIQCHVISTFMAGLFTALFCLVRIRQTLRKEVLLQLVKAVACTVFTNLWFLLPFLEYIGFDYNVSGLGVHSRGRYASHAAFLSQLISFFPQGEGASIVTGKMWDTDSGTEMSYTLGGGMMLALVLYVVYRLYDRRKMRQDLCAGACVLSLLMTTPWFPWDFLQQRSDLIAWVTGSIQFPWRFLTIATVTGAFAAACLIHELRQHSRMLLYGAVFSISFLTLLSANYFLQDYEKRSVPEYTTAYEIDSWWLGCQEYIPKGTDGTTFYTDTLQDGEGLAIQEYVRREGYVKVGCENARAQEISVDVPILYYKGYAARDVDTGGRLEVLPADNMRVRVIVPAGYRGAFEVKFEPPRHWRVCEIVSCLTVLCLLLYAGKYRKGAI